MAFNVKSAVVWSVPPPKVKWLDWTEPGTAPKLLSELILNIPALIVFVPVIELEPESVRV